MNKLINFLKGKKTFIVCGVTFVFAILGLVLGKLSTQDAIEIVLASAGAASLRDAIKK